MANSDILHQKSAIYIRVSTHWQIDKDSLTVQEQELIAYSNLVLNIPDYTVFRDPGYSGKNTERPAYQEMMSALRTGEYSHLLVWKIDRISRNLIDFCSMYNELKSMGITFISKSEQFDTSSAIGGAMLKIILVFAELERQMTAERVTAVMLSRANSGKWNGGKIPFGYSYDKKSKLFSINNSEAQTIKFMFNHYEEHQSILTLAESLNSQGIKTRAGNTWSGVTVHNILKNPFYKGFYVYNVHSDGRGINKRDPSEWITIENHHPPIIDDVQFDRIQYILSRNKRGGPSPHRTYTHIFSGLLKCGLCDSLMTSTPGKIRANGYRPTIYACSLRRREKGCSNKYTNDLEIGPFIINYISNLVKIQNSPPPPDSNTLQKLLLQGKCFHLVSSINQDALDSTLNLLNHKLDYSPPDQKNLSSSISSLTEQKRKYENALNRLKSLYLYSDSPLSEKDYIIEQQSIKNKLASIESQISSSISTDITDSNMISTASYNLMANAFLHQKYIDYEKYIRALDPTVIKRFLNTIISSITITNGKVDSITMKNGITHSFTYSTKNNPTAP